MKVARTFAVVLGFLFAHAVAHAQSDSFSADGDPTPFPTILTGAPSLIPQQSGYGLMWSGTYTLAPGDSVWAMNAIAIDVNNTNLKYGAPTTWIGGKWQLMTPELPNKLWQNPYINNVKYRKPPENVQFCSESGGFVRASNGTYVLYIKCYVQRPDGTIVHVTDLQSIAVTLP